MASAHLNATSDAAKTEAVKLENDENTLDDGFANLAQVTGSGDQVPFSAKELQILDLYDQLREVELEKALVIAQTMVTQDPVIDAAAAGPQLKEAERLNLEARAAYVLKNSIVSNVVQADPILKAVHAGSNATPTEAALHPVIDRRDALSIAQTNLSSSLQSTLNALTLAQAENAKVLRRNRELAATLWDLASQLKAQDLDGIDDIELREKLERSQKESRESRRRFRILKGLTAGVVAGSGVDWARDDELRALVLDDED